MVKEQKSDLGLQFGNRGKEILEHIDTYDVNIIGVYDEELQ